MKQFIMHEETGIAAPMKSKEERNKVKEFFDSKGTTYVPRAKEQHIGHIDRRGALLRDTIHRIVEQCKLEHFTMPFEQFLGDAVFAGNCLISINGSTPYMNLYGRTPTMLPDVTVIDDSIDPGSIRHTEAERNLTAADNRGNCSSQGAH